MWTYSPETVAYVCQVHVLIVLITVQTAVIVYDPYNYLRYGVLLYIQVKLKIECHVRIRKYQLI